MSPRDREEEERILSVTKSNHGYLTQDRRNRCAMKEGTVVSLLERAEVEAKSPLEPLIAQGAHKMLQAASENEVQGHLQAYGGRQTDDGQALVVRNSHLPDRDLVTGVGLRRLAAPR